MATLASAFNIGDTQAHLNVPLSGVGSGNFNVKIDDELLHVGGVENRTGLTLAMSFAATANHAQGATVTPVLDAFTTDATSPFASGGPGGGIPQGGPLTEDLDADGFAITNLTLDTPTLAEVMDEGHIAAGTLDMADSQIVGLAEPSNSGDAVNKGYVDDRLLGAVIDPLPEVPAAPTEQDIVDALLALGLVTQAP